MLLQLFREIIYREHEQCDIVPINSRFQSLCDYIEVTDDKVFEHYPIALFEIFSIQQQIPRLKGIRASTIRLIRQNLHLIDDEFRQSPKVTKLFIQILGQTPGITHQLRRMNRYGILAAYIPAFANIVGRIQYDLFHIYTVDQHTLFLIRNLRRFALDKHNDELPFCNDVFRLIRKPELLYLAALFHDIAKGKGVIIQSSAKPSPAISSTAPAHGTRHRACRLVGAQPFGYVNGGTTQRFERSRRNSRICNAGR